MNRECARAFPWLPGGPQLELNAARSNQPDLIPIAFDPLSLASIYSGKRFPDRIFDGVEYVSLV